jgi:putative membrane protein
MLPMTQLALRGALAIIGFWIATQMVDGISFDTPATLLFAGLLLGVINAILRPVLVILTLPITVLSLGLFLLLINSAMVGLVAALLPGMHVAGFRAALFTAITVSVVSWIGNAFTRS